MDLVLSLDRAVVTEADVRAEVLPTFLCAANPGASTCATCHPTCETRAKAQWQPKLLTGLFVCAAQVRRLPPVLFYAMQVVQLAQLLALRPVQDALSQRRR